MKVPDTVMAIGDGAVKYANGAKVKDLAMDGGTKHLYAIWRLAE